MLTEQKNANTKEKTAQAVKETHIYVEGGEVHYLLLREDGAERAAFGTPCTEIYTLRIQGSFAEGGTEVCTLRDIARHEEGGIRLLELFSRNGVLPSTAEEIAEEVLLC